MFALCADLRFCALFWRFCFMLIAVLYSGASVPYWSIFSSMLIVVLYSVSGIFWFPCSVSADAPVSCHVPVPCSCFRSVLGTSSCWCSSFMSCSSSMFLFQVCVGHQFLLMLQFHVMFQFHVPVLGLCWAPVPVDAPVSSCCCCSVQEELCNTWAASRTKSANTSFKRIWLEEKCWNFSTPWLRTFASTGESVNRKKNGQWLHFSPSHAVLFASCS